MKLNDFENAIKKCKFFRLGNGRNAKNLFIDNTYMNFVHAYDIDTHEQYTFDIIELWGFSLNDQLHIYGNLRLVLKHKLESNLPDSDDIHF
jgi:hypothetical protein